MIESAAIDISQHRGNIFGGGQYQLIIHECHLFPVISPILIGLIIF